MHGLHLEAIYSGLDLWLIVTLIAEKNQLKLKISKKILRMLKHLLESSRQEVEVTSQKMSSED